MLEESACAPAGQGCNNAVVDAMAVLEMSRKLPKFPAFSPLDA